MVLYCLYLEIGGEGVLYWILEINFRDKRMDLGFNLFFLVIYWINIKIYLYFVIVFGLEKEMFVLFYFC